LDLSVPRDEASSEEQYRWLLMLRFALLNLTALAIVLGAWAQGWLDGMIASDKYHLVKLNVCVFLVGMVMCAHRLSGLSRELNELSIAHPDGSSRVGHYLRMVRDLGPNSRSMLVDGLKMKFGTRLGSIRHLASTIVLVGLVGTVIGFIIALSGVDATAATQPSAIAPMISTLLLGMAIALYKTLVGSVLNIWLMFNYRLLESGSVHLVTRLVERGEADARL